MSTPIATHDPSGRVNGWLLPLWNANERPDLRPEQVYLTAVSPGCSKGPHLHKRREQRFYVICGDVEIIRRIPVTGEYIRTMMWRGDSLVIAPGTPAQIVNRGHGEAWIINMPAPAWSREEPDEWPVEDWTAYARVDADT